MQIIVIVKQRFKNYYIFINNCSVLSNENENLATLIVGIFLFIWPRLTHIINVLLDGKNIHIFVNNIF